MPSTEQNHAGGKVILHHRLESMSRKAAEHGDAFAFPRGWIFSHPDSVREILVTHDAKFCKTRLLRWARWTLGNGLLTSDGDLHRRQRPMIQPTLHPKRLAAYAETMVRHAVATARSWSDGQTINAHREMTALTLHIVAEALFGQALGPEVDAISHAMDYNVRAFMRMTTRLGRILAFLPTPFSIRYLMSRRKVLSVLRRFIANRRASGDQRDDLLGRLIAARTSDGQPAMSEQQLVDECVTLFAAGHETTASALTFTLWLIAHYPDVQSRLDAEVEGVPNQSAGTLTIDDVDRLPYTRMVLAESMRLYPPAWIQGREAIEDLTINGTPVQRGQTIFVSQWLTHRDTRWWPEPSQFDPTRFDDKQPPTCADGSARPRWAYFPFGGGSRSCVGEAFAWTEMILVLATLISQRRFIPVAGAAPVHLEPGITLRPGSLVSLIVRDRHATK